MTIADFALNAFTFFNAARVLAYVPQLLRIARDREGAKAVSCATWVLFAVSHLSTIGYALAVAPDPMMVMVFSANAAGCTCIIVLTILKRRTAHKSGACGVRAGSDRFEEAETQAACRIIANSTRND